MRQGPLLAACDHLIAELLVETAEQAAAYLGSGSGEDDEPVRAVTRMLAFLEAQRAASVPEVLSGAWSTGGEGTEAACTVRALWDEIAGSPLFERWAEGVDVAFARALESGSLFAASRPGDLELSGWLEAPWSEASRLAVAGFVEGCVPASVTEHLFLPDSRRRALGLADNAARRARDAYLLTCLARVRGPDEFRCSFSKFGVDGGPGLPSGLLLRCADAELPVRVQAVFAPVQGGGTQPRRENGWRWHLPEALRKTGIARMSPTDFKQYLACPFRFYFQRVLRIEEFDPRAREMDAMRFGSLIHRALEHFAKEVPEVGEAERIERIVIERMEAEARRWFGPDPSPAVRVQLEAVRLRLRAFARLQAAEFASGWRIVEAERKLAADDPDPLRVGGLAISAQIDRIDRHPEHGLRIIDYKTFATAKTPEQTHLGGATANDFLPEAQVIVGDRMKCWVDLQLPLYRVIAARWYPGPAVQAAYLVLPADPEGTAMEAFELDDRLQASAMACAEAVARRVGAGMFWPPQPPPGNWEDPFASLFLNGSPERSLDAETITFLKGEA
jgi:ATP-dependent helicase/nuclease subunit B